MKAIIKNPKILAEMESRLGKSISYITDGMGEDIIVFADETVAYCFINLIWDNEITAEVSLLDEETNDVKEKLMIKL
jgi:hypothetical protein